MSAGVCHIAVQRLHAAMRMNHSGLRSSSAQQHLSIVSLFCHVGYTACWRRSLAGVQHEQDASGHPDGGLHRPILCRYRFLFQNVRHFEHFTALHLGLLAETRHKSLPRLGKAVHADPQALHHFLAKAEWSVRSCGAKRLELLRQALGETPFILFLDERGIARRGTRPTTRASVHWQSAYAGQRRRLGQCVWCARHDDVSAALPRLQASNAPQRGDVSRASRNWRSRLLKSSWRWAFASASSWPTASTGKGEFTSALADEAGYVVAIRSNHGVWLLPGQRVRQTRFRPFERIFTDGSTERRFLRERSTARAEPSATTRSRPTRKTCRPNDLTS